jgi:hypothetical protein
MVRTKWIIVGIVAAIIFGILLAVFWDFVIGTIGAVVMIAIFLLAAFLGGGSGSDDADDDDDEDED